MCRKINGKSQTGKNGFDKCLVPFLSIINRAGVKTQFSCCGHLSESPNIILEPGSKNLAKLLSLLKGDYLDWIIEIKNIGPKQFHIFFESTICTPPQYPSWVSCKEDVRDIQKLRKDFGLPLRTRKK